MQTFRKYSSKYFVLHLSNCKNMDIPKNFLDLLIIFHNLFMHFHAFLYRHRIEYKYPSYILYSFMSILLFNYRYFIKEILILNTDFKKQDTWNIFSCYIKYRFSLFFIHVNIYLTIKKCFQRSEFFSIFV